MFCAPEERPEERFFSGLAGSPAGARGACVLSHGVGSHIFRVSGGWRSCWRLDLGGEMLGWGWGFGHMLCFGAGACGALSVHSPFFYCELFDDRVSQKSCPGD